MDFVIAFVVILIIGYVLNNDFPIIRLICGYLIFMFIFGYGGYAAYGSGMYLVHLVGCGMLLIAVLVTLMAIYNLLFN